ncbi:hypothetical protein QCB44_03045 [Thiomicrorhabdus sp. zzn3]|uniref:hypothetical protein n=1 Tax=Thiomicrorhabdus sp. zzn3 TaxID=3039775 RepID=UPI00243668D6|nr:hypothetical protein [Thiomicrorhabdus sp. zzn3]MDG6777676.1 hypothetical protein [Thiomicrorhabdus sp. zzn3]
MLLPLPEKPNIPIILNEFSKLGDDVFDSQSARICQYVNEGLLELYFDYSGMSFYRSIYLVEALANLVDFKFDSKKELDSFVDEFRQFEELLNERNLDINVHDFELSEFIHKRLPLDYGFFNTKPLTNQVGTIGNLGNGRISLVNLDRVLRVGVSIRVGQIEEITQDHILFGIDFSAIRFTPYQDRENGGLEVLMNFKMPLSEVYTNKLSLELLLGIKSPIIEQVKPEFQDIENKYYSRELDISVKAHQAVFKGGYGNQRHALTTRIRTWLEENYPDESDAFYRRVVTVVNPKK